MTKKMEESDEQLKRCSDICDTTENLPELFQQMNDRFAKFGGRLQEMDNMWLFYQRFIDEQANDVIRTLRGIKSNLL